MVPSAVDLAPRGGACGCFLASSIGPDVPQPLKRRSKVEAGPGKGFVATPRGYFVKQERALLDVSGTLCMWPSFPGAVPCPAAAVMGRNCEFPPLAIDRIG